VLLLLLLVTQQVNGIYHLILSELSIQYMLYIMYANSLDLSEFVFVLTIQWNHYLIKFTPFE